MIHTTRPAAASRKWLRISGGRTRFPPFPWCCIPPRLNQIESRTNPPPAVITQAISAAHPMTPPSSSSGSAAVLYTASRSLSSIGTDPAAARPQRDEDPAVRRIVLAAIAGVARDLAEIGALECTGNEAGPHAVVEPAQLGLG